MRLTAIRVGGGGVTVSEVVALTLPELAVILAVALLETAVVVITKEAVVAPPGTETAEGTTTDWFPLTRLTTHPLDGAAFVSVTVPVALVPATTVVGFTETLLTGMLSTSGFNATTSVPFG